MMTIRKIYEQPNTDNWAQFFQGKLSFRLAKVEVEIDAKGFPVVLLVKKDGSLVVKITEGMYYASNNLTSIHKKANSDISGYWTKTQGSKLKLKLTFKKFIF